MRRVILRDMAVLFLLNLTHLGSQSLILLDEVLVSLVSGYEHNVWVHVAEGDLSADGVSRRVAHSLARQPS